MDNRDIFQLWARADVKNRWNFFKEFPGSKKLISTFLGKNPRFAIK